MKAAWIGVVGVTVAVLGGCMMGPDYRRPDLPVPETYRFLPEDASLQALDSCWWEDFGDPVLNGMVEEAIANNRDSGRRWRIRKRPPPPLCWPVPICFRRSV